MIIIFYQIDLHTCSFNGLDGRLERELEAVLVIMEACEGFESIVRYDVVGHSGESEAHLFVDAMSPPSNADSRFKVIQVPIYWHGEMQELANN